MTTSLAEAFEEAIKKAKLKPKKPAKETVWQKSEESASTSTKKAA